MNELAQALGVLLGTAIKSMGREGVEALMRGFSDALKDEAVFAKSDPSNPAQQLVNEWMRQQVRSGAAGDGGDGHKGN